MPKLVDAYLKLQSMDNGEGFLESSTQPGESVGPPIQIEVVDIFCESHVIPFAYVVNSFVVRRQLNIPVLSGDVYPNESLLHRGYLGSSPLQPTLAFSIRTLAAYRQSHRTCPRFSIEAQCRMLCHMNQVHTVAVDPFRMLYSHLVEPRSLTSLISQHSFPPLMILILKSVGMLKNRLILHLGITPAPLASFDHVPVAFTSSRAKLSLIFPVLFPLTATIR